MRERLNMWPTVMCKKAETGRQVLLAGATGGLGRPVVEELRRRGCKVRALVRDAAKAERLHAAGVEVFAAADARRPASLEGACDGVESVVSVMGASLRLGRTREGGATYRDVDYRANLNLLEQARRAGVRKFVYVSLHGAQRLAGVAYADAHEDFVGALAASRMDYAVVRPTGFFRIFAEIFEMARRRGRVALVGDGTARTNPVHERDVARVCADALNGDAREIEIGGPEIYTRREIAELAFAALGRRAKLHSVPANLVRALIHPVRLFDRRLYEFLDFGVAVNTLDCVAPAAGRESLKSYFQQLAEAARPATSHAEIVPAHAGD
ncbi:MAG: SDR family oxidoreductase [Pyrinomonadaceae bacterium]